MVWSPQKTDPRMRICIQVVTPRSPDGGGDLRPGRRSCRGTNKQSGTWGPQGDSLEQTPQGSRPRDLDFLCQTLKVLKILKSLECGVSTQ